MLILNTYLGKKDTYHWPYFFIIKSDDTRKSYIIHLLINLLKNKHSNYLLIALTDVAT